MDKLLSELLARVEILEHDVTDLQHQIDKNGVMFVADLGILADDRALTAEQFLDAWDPDKEPEQ